jgi:predicted NUDIX family phosphoesterase
VQPIAAAIVRRGDDYLVLRRIDGTRGDLRSRISLISGGHVDFVESEFDFEAILEQTLARELNEELGFTVTSSIEPFGVVVDHANIASSRHAAFLFEVFVTDDAEVLAGEEFVLGSSFSGSFVDLATLSLFSPNFDPWSRIVWRDSLLGRLDAAMGATPQQLSIRGLPRAV